MPTPRLTDTVVIEPHTILVFPEGHPNLPILEYDTEAGTWSERRPSSVLGAGTESVFELGQDGFIYHFSFTTVHRYDPEANRWEPSALVELEEFVSDAVALADGSFLLVGRGMTTTCLRLFDPVTLIESPLRCEAGAYWWGEAAGDGTVLVFGESGVARYDPEGDTWRAYGPPPTDLFGIGIGVGPDGRVYAFSGPRGILPGVSLAFDADDGVWLSVPLPPVGKHLPEVVAGPDGRLYLIGGNPLPPPAYGPSQLELTVEVFEPAR
jgi:hypothetical protein